MEKSSGRRWVSVNFSTFPGFQIVEQVNSLLAVDVYRFHSSQVPLPENKLPGIRTCRIGTCRGNESKCLRVHVHRGDLDGVAAHVLGHVAKDLLHRHVASAGMIHGEIELLVTEPVQ